VLKRLDFPAYCIKLLDNGLIAIAGGGGTSKTGVTNWIEIGHINFNETTSSSSSSSASPPFQTEFKLIAKLETNDAIMKFVCFSLDKSPAKSLSGDDNNNINNQRSTPNHSICDFYLAAAINNIIEIYKIQSKITKTATDTDTNDSIATKSAHESDQNHLIKRKKSSSSSSTSQQPKLPNGNVTMKSSDPPTAASNLEASAELKLVSCIRLRGDNEAASSGDESIVSLQVHKSKSAVQLCAGTSKGSIVVWSLQLETNNNLTNKINFEKWHEFEQAHGTSEIDDLQINSDGCLLSIGKDNRCCVWSLSTCAKLLDLDYTRTLNNDKNLRMKHARFSHDSSLLYTTYIPRVRNGSKNLCSYIQKWSRTAVPSAAAAAESSKQNGFHPNNNHHHNHKDKPAAGFSYKLDKTFRLQGTIITSIQSSKDGYFISVGDCDGKIYLFDCHFDEIKHFKKSHSSVITDLLFYHDCELLINTNNNNNNKNTNGRNNEAAVNRSSKLGNVKTGPSSASSSSANVKLINDLNKLILSISIDRTIQLYKFINTNNYLLSNLVKPRSNSFVNCCFSMGLFKFIFVLIVFILLFCYFFTYVE
jgi:hypothetical protein